MVADPVRREYLFLQGLAGPFFSRLGERLRRDGHGVHRVNFHGGDWLFWRGPAVNYRGGASEWPETVEALIRDRRITDIVLFGDCRPLHRAAVRVAERLQVAIHVFEEGYIRPDWVTVERGGVNGNSALPRNLGYYRDTAAGLPPVGEDLDHLPPVPTSFRRRATEDLAYNIAAMLLGWYFHGYSTHRPWHPLVEYAGWARRLLGKGRAQRHAVATIDAIRAGGEPFFVFPLQLDCDYQVRQHSPYRSLQPAIDHVLGSFAAHAPSRTRLVVKAHPLDNGLTNWATRVADTAARHGIADRITFVDGGDISLLSAASRGMVTINSTSGTLALAQGVPVIVLGQAVYNIPGITDAGVLDDFWRDPRPAEPGAFEAFRRVLVSRCLVRGGYFSEAGLGMLVDGAAARLARPEERVRAPLSMPSPLRALAPALQGAVRG